MLAVNKKTILLFALGCFLNNSFATTIPTSKEQNIEYQKEADKYKELYEKYQKLADEANSKKVIKKADEKEDSKSAEKPIVEQKNIVPPVQDKADIKPTKDSKEPEAVVEPWDGTDFGIGATVATGDSATTNVNLMSNISYKPFKEWSSKAFLNYVYSSNDRPGERAVKINKTQIRGETAWNFTKKMQPMVV